MKSRAQQAVRLEIQVLIVMLPQPLRKTSGVFGSAGYMDRLVSPQPPALLSTTPVARRVVRYAPAMQSMRSHSVIPASSVGL